jgi:hypothetical protein
MKQYAALDDTIYFWFAGNDTSGSGGDGASPAADVRLAGAAADVAPVYSPTPVLLSHVNYPAGAYEIAITASAANGFAANNTYAVFCTLAIDSQNPTGFVGSFDTKPVESNPTQIGNSAQSLTDLKDFADAGYDPDTNKITGTADMRGTDSANTTTPPTVAAIRQEMDTNSTKMAPSQTLNDYKATGFSTHNAADVWTSVTRALTDKSGFALSAAGANLILKDSTFALAIADAIWDEILTGGLHNIVNSAGRRVREIGAYAIESGTAQAATSNNITLAATASANDGVYNRSMIVIVDNTGIGQTRTIVDYNGTTKVAVIDRDWRVTPDATTAYQITADNTPLVVDQGVAQGGTSTTITLREYASAVDDTYLCNVVAIIAGTGRGQARLVGSYVGSTKVVTICGDNWVTNPDVTSVYVMMPYGTTCTSCVGTYALGLINTECDTALTDYAPNTVVPDVAGTAAGLHTTTDGKVDAVQTDATTIKAKTDNLPSGMAKNVAVPKFDVFMVLSSDHVTGATGKTVTGTISKDGGAFTALTNPIAEVSGGMYTMASGLTQAERNADVSTLIFSAADCDDRIITIISS